jgi:Putative auto-transporter adhesin, head GIN domain
MGLTKGIGVVMAAVVLSAGMAFAMSRTGTVDCLHGEGPVRTERRNLSPFTQIEVNGAFDLQVVCGRGLKIEVTAQDNLLSHIRTRIYGPTLVIDTDAAICTQKALRIDIGTPRLGALTVNGAVDATVSGIDAPGFSLALSGAGDVQLSGKATTLDARLTGAGDLRAETLQTRRTVVVLDGAGEAAVHASRHLTATIAGAGDITVYGNPPQIDETITGMGEVTRN